MLVETAVAIPLLLVLVITLAWVLGAVAAKNQTTELAHAVAAQAARGAVEDIERLRAEAGRESLIDISVDGDLIRVTVRRSVPVPGPVLDGLSLDVTSSALALREM